jgi:glycosyltransferase involved in cell wall biosynthesis
VRILVVAALYPWPAVDGYRQRVSNVIGGLAAAGTVDVVAPRRAEDPAPGPSPWPGVARATAVPVPPARGIRTWGPEWAAGDAPRRVLALDWTDVRAALAGGAGDHDLVWYSLVDSWWQTHDLLEGPPSVLDVDNLDNLALRLRRRVPPRFEGGGAVTTGRDLGRWGVSRGFDLVDERRFDRLLRRCSGSVDRIVVCSELDVARSGLPNAVCVPNGADEVVDPVVDRRRLRGSAPVLGFVGNLGYEPNREAVEWFVAEVLPVVRAHRPDVRFRVVGPGGEALARNRTAGLELVGRVEDLRGELDATDVSVVPIRIGAGTRLKVVEALANHLPMVTTTVGCEGIDVVDGESALIADDARTFADACLRLVADGELRQRLADRGAELFADRYAWSGIRDRVTDLARLVAGPTA